MIDTNSLTLRKATIDDLPKVVTLLIQDELGEQRESNIDLTPYKVAYQKIASDPNQHLMVVTDDLSLLGTCHLTVIPSLTFVGASRLNIEAVRVSKDYRGKGVGEWMFQKVEAFAKQHDCKIMQLASNTQRKEAIRFYQKIGYEPTHIGFKRYLTS